MNVASMMSERAAEFGGQPAIIEGYGQKSRVLTFAGLERKSIQAAAFLHKAGFKPGDCILILQPASIELYAVIIGLLRLGLTAMFADSSAGIRRIEEYCRIHPPKGFIGSPRAHLLKLFSPTLSQIPIQFSCGGRIWGSRVFKKADSKASSKMHGCDEDTPALIRFTSGSTGQPKGIVRSHGFLFRQLEVLSSSFELVSGETDFCTMPMFVLSNLSAGVTSILPTGNMLAPGCINPKPMVRQILETAPQRIDASPAFLERIADHCIGKTQTLWCVEKILTGGGPVSPNLMDKLHSIAPQAEIFGVYGSTEAEPIAVIPYRKIRERDRQDMVQGAGLLAGKPVDEIQLRILREELPQISVPMTEEEFASLWESGGHPGQIVVSGPHVQRGYWKGVGDSETKLNVEGTVWHRTGDAGYVDAEGRLWLLGRCSARIVDARGSLYPLPVEIAACQQPGVRRAALFRRENQRLLVIEAGKELHLPGLRKRLAWASLDTILPVRKIPMDKRHNSKIDYSALKELVS